MDFQCDGMEARVGIEPTHKGFADLSLTSWVPRLETYSIPKGRRILAGRSGGGTVQPFC
jgi:hypothetical protein